MHTSSRTLALNNRKRAAVRIQGNGTRISDIDIDIGADARWHTLVDDDAETDPFYDPPYRRPRDALKQDIAEFTRLIDDGMAAWPLDDSVDAGPLRVALGKYGKTERLLLSNGVVRAQAGSLMIDVVSAHWKATRGLPHRTWWFLTFVSDCGNTLEYEPVVGIRSLHGRVDKLIRAAKLNAICSIEVQGLTNFPQRGHGRTLMFHAHAIAWSDDPDFDASSTERKLCASRTLQNRLGAKTVTIRPVPNEHRHLTWRAYYLLKAPVLGKYVQRSQTSPSGLCLAKTRIRPDFAVRIMEGLTQLDFTQTVFGVGEGARAISRPWKANLLRWHKRHRRRVMPLPGDFDMAGLWNALRVCKGRSRRASYVFVETGALSVPSAWALAADARLAEYRQPPR